jgi:hypothetical protein
MLMRRDWEGDEVCRDHVQVECCSSPGSELLSHAHEFAASSLFCRLIRPSARHGPAREC